MEDEQFQPDVLPQNQVKILAAETERVEVKPGEPKQPSPTIPKKRGAKCKHVLRHLLRNEQEQLREFNLMQPLSESTSAVTLLVAATNSQRFRMSVTVTILAVLLPSLAFHCSLKYESAE